MGLNEGFVEKEWRLAEGRHPNGRDRLAERQEAGRS